MKSKKEILDDIFALDVTSYDDYIQNSGEIIADLIAGAPTLAGLVPMTGICHRVAQSGRAAGCRLRSFVGSGLAGLWRFHRPWLPCPPAGRTAPAPVTCQTRVALQCWRPSRLCCRACLSRRVRQS